MLPIPVEKYIPVFFDRDNDLIVFANKLDEYLIEWGDETLALNDLKDPVRVPADLIIELGQLLAADILNSDSERTKREKVATSIQGLKNRSTWKFDVKPKIDAIAGGDSQLLSAVGAEDWILVGDDTVPPSYDWGCLGGNESDCFLRLVGEGTEAVIKGNIYIDVDNDSLTPSEVDQLVETLADVAPAYYRITLGYIDGSGDFVTYAVIN